VGSIVSYEVFNKQEFTMKCVALKNGIRYFAQNGMALIVPFDEKHWGYCILELKVV
jgi:hypothetical protein